MTEQVINRTIKRMQDYLFSQQQPNGGFDISPAFTNPKQKNFGGETVLTVLALLRSGVNPQDPRLAKALTYLKSIKLNGTYPTGIVAEAWAELPDSYLPELKADARWLLKAARNHDGLFHYTLDDKSYDRSTTQYGVLGLWSYNRRGGHTPKAFWDKILRDFVSSQHDDGGWQYGPGANGKSTGSMTAAGLTVEYIAQEQLFRNRETPKKLQDSIRRGLAWFDKNFTADSNPGFNNQHHFYYLYGVERVGLASGIKYFGKHDWFKEGARVIINSTYPKGSAHSGSIKNNIPETDFGLIFLSRGHVPVWACKLRIPGKAWNKEPNDLYFLSEFLSNDREHHLNFQVVSIDDNPRRWLNAPLAYLSYDGPVDLTADQKAHLKAYLDRGGMIFANPTGSDTSGFYSSLIKLFKELYPQYKFKPLSPKDPLANINYNLGGSSRVPVNVLSNGARDLACITSQKYSHEYQSGTKYQGIPWKFAVNLYADVTDHGQVANRLEVPFPAPAADMSPTKQLKIGQLKYDGNWNPEPGTSLALKRMAIKRSKLGVETETVSFADLAASKLPLIVIDGTEAVKFTDSQIKEIIDYAKGGGHIFIQTVGGHGRFASKLSDQLASVLKNAPERIDLTSPIISGEGLTNGYDCSSVDFRRFTVIKSGAQHEPRLLTMNVGKKPAILISNEDLDEGVLGVQQWGINGYYRDSARHLWINLLLDAQNGFHK